ncbi:thioester-forming surface-anchored protein [Streptococcus halichoeri]|uniref:thioester-forming surface-anchored protein n=1 Tax=Streptococcus halichoeri TaxID=254785 RepID=UPI001F1EFBF2|nr:thioester-forming surface-anchored protein [Streptococcus halichoeri]
MLAASAACFIFSISSAGGSLQVWAEDYYGWNDGTRNQSPFFLYVTPKDNSTRSTEDKYVVYCFNKEKHWPDNWYSDKISYPSLPLYSKELGTKELFNKIASKPKVSDKITESLVAVLSKGYPTIKNIENLDETSSRKITQLAIWYFTDSFPKNYFKENYSLSETEDRALQNLIAAGEKPNLDESQKKQTLDLYIYKSGGKEHYYNYQNLLGSTLIPKIPASETEIHSNLIELNFEGIIEKHSNTNSNLLEGSSQKYTLEETPRVPKIIMGQRGYTLPGKEGISDTAIEFTKDTGGSEELLGSANAIETVDSKIPHIIGHGGKLAGEAGETQQAGQTGGHTPTIEITQDTQEGMSGSCASQTETEDTQKPTVIMGSQGQPIETSESTQGGMSGQSGNATETDDTKQPDVILGGQGQVINTEENLSGINGQFGNITETDDTKQPDVILGGQGQVINTEENLSGINGQFGNITETDDTKQPDVILGGQGQVINTEERLSGMSGQSGNATETDDTKQPDVILGGQGHVIDISEHSSTGMSGSCDSLTTLEDAEHSTADSDTKQAGKERRLPQTSDQEHLPLSLLMPVILLLISLRAIFKYPFKDNN